MERGRKIKKAPQLVIDTEEANEKPEPTVQSFIDEAIGNIRHDRGVTNSLLIDLIQQMKQSSDDMKHLSISAAKYVETLQRSNEQLVKVAGLIQKKHTKDNNLTESDKQDLFELIKGSGE
tara:strand:+ start:1060 stop:1419 length:360 start_codon:yes stop_codon:yes gene_type:complete